MVKKTKPPAKAGSAVPKSKGRKKQTRDKILKAAREIFSSLPYHSASIRMIGKLAGIEHPLISYYFPSKADLFRAVISELTDYHFRTETERLNEIRKMDPGQALPLFIDYVLDDFRKQPGLLNIVALNLTQPANIEAIPGYDLIQEFMQIMTGSLIETISLKASQQEGEMFARTISTLLVSFLGASNAFAAMVDMEPDSIRYYNWVKDTLVFTLLPRLEMMVGKNPPSE